MDPLLFILIFTILVFVSMIPSIVALEKNHRNKGLIFFANILLGWTGIGWLICLIWACQETTSNLGSNTYVADEIEKLGKLKEQDLITEEEFKTKKQELLNKL